MRITWCYQRGGGVESEMALSRELPRDVRVLQTSCSQIYQRGKFKSSCFFTNLSADIERMRGKALRDRQSVLDRI